MSLTIIGASAGQAGANCPIPASTAAGDIILVLASGTPVSGSMAGWTTLQTGAGDLLYVKQATGTDPAIPAPNVDSAGQVATALTIRGAGVPAPSDVSPLVNTGISDTTIPSFAPPDTGMLIVGVHANFASIHATVSTPTNAFTPIVAVAGANGYGWVFLEPGKSPTGAIDVNWGGFGGGRLVTVAVALPAGSQGLTMLV